MDSPLEDSQVRGLAREDGCFEGGVSWKPTTSSWQKNIFKQRWWPEELSITHVQCTPPPFPSTTQTLTPFDETWGPFQKAGSPSPMFQPKLGTLNCTTQSFRFPKNELTIGLKNIWVTFTLSYSCARRSKKTKEKATHHCQDLVISICKPNT